MLNKIIINYIGLQVELIPWMGGFNQVFEGEEIIFTGAYNPIVVAQPKRYGFEITVNDGKQTIYQNLLAMYKAQFISETLSPVSVHDYISPDSGDLTIRDMVITEVKQVGSSLRHNGGNYTKGTTVKLLETRRGY